MEQLQSSPPNEGQLKEEALENKAAVKLCTSDIANYVIHKKLEVARAVVKHKDQVGLQMYFCY